MRNLLLAALLGALPVSAQSPSADVSVGVFPFLVGNMDSRINEIVSNCQTYGIDTLYVSAFRATGPQTGDLWVTDSAGDWNPAWGAVRSTGAGIHLQNLITACHAANVRVVAVMKCFNDNVQPTDAAHKQYLLDVIDYFVDAYRPDGQPVYDLDGIALDYIRFVGSGTGNDPSLVTNFLADVRQRLRGLSLHCYLIASRFTFDGPNYDGNFSSYASVTNSFSSQYGQNWQQMAQHCDVLMPMAYTANGSIYNSTTLHRAYVQQAAAYARTACSLAGFPGRRVVPVVKTYTGESETTTVSTIDASIQGALLGGGDGYQSFRYQFLVNNPTWWGPMQNWAVPGCNWPVPLATPSSSTLTVQFDPSLSRDADQASASLQARFDWNHDGVFDTGWQALAPATGQPRFPGVWVGCMQVRDAQNHVSTTRRRYTAGPGVTVSPPFVSAGLGGNVQIDFRTGTAAANAPYVTLVTISGTSPGVVWQPGFPIPINVDFVTQAFLADPNSPLLPGGTGNFDAQGRATATLVVPPGVLTPLVGGLVHVSFAAVNAIWQPLCVGEADPILVIQ